MILSHCNKLFQLTGVSNLLYLQHVVWSVINTHDKGFQYIHVGHKDNFNSTLKTNQNRSNWLSEEFDSNLWNIHLCTFMNFSEIEFSYQYMINIRPLKQLDNQSTHNSQSLSVIMTQWLSIIIDAPREDKNNSWMLVMPQAGVDYNCKVGVPSVPPQGIHWIKNSAVRSSV